MRGKNNISPAIASQLSNSAFVELQVVIDSAILTRLVDPLVSLLHLFHAIPSCAAGEDMVLIVLPAANELSILDVIAAAFLVSCTIHSS